MILENFKIWWNIIDDAEKCKHIKNFAINMNNTHKRMVKATKAEIDFGPNRRGSRGGRFTTLNATSQRATSAYLELVDELKYMIKLL